MEEEIAVITIRYLDINGNAQEKIYTLADPDGLVSGANRLHTFLQSMAVSGVILTDDDLGVTEVLLPHRMLGVITKRRFVSANKDTASVA